MNRIAFLPVARKFFHGDLWTMRREFSDAEAWLDMLALAAYQPETRLCSGHAISLQPGELIGSLRFLADRWTWSKGRTERFLGALRKAGRMTFRDANGTASRVIRLCNWELYNPPRDKLGTETGQHPGQQRDKVEEGEQAPSGQEAIAQTNNRRPRDLSVVQAQAAICGCPPEEAERFWHHFEASGWVDKNGNPVRNWLSKLANWTADARTKPAESAHRANSDKPERARTLSVSDMRTILQAKDDESRAIKDRFCAQVAMGEHWNDDEQRRRYFAMRREIKELRGRIAKLA